MGAPVLIEFRAEAPGFCRGVFLHPSRYRLHAKKPFATGETRLDACRTYAHAREGIAGAAEHR
jgi:hypothetical protein